MTRGSRLLLPALLALFATATAVAAESEAVRAQLRAKRETVLSAGTAGRIVRLPFEEGASFQKGQLLAGFDCSVLQAEQSYARAELKAAKAQLAADTKLDALGSISTLEVALSRAKVEMAEAKLALNRAKQRNCREKAPFSGRVVRKVAHRYQRVGEGEPLLSILDPSLLKVELQVPSRWLRWLKKGTPFSLHIDEIDQDFTAKVVSLGAQVDAVSQTIMVQGELKSGKAPVLPGMSGSARFTLPEEP